MSPIRLVASLLGIRFASRSIARRRRALVPRWWGRDWVLEDRRLLTSPGPVPLAATQAAALLHDIRGHAPQILERIHHETFAGDAAHPTNGDGKHAPPSNGVPPNEGTESKGVAAPAPTDSDGSKDHTLPRESNPHPGFRPKYAIAGAAAVHGSPAAGPSALAAGGIGGVPATATAVQVATPTQAVTPAHSGILPAGASHAETATRGLSGDVPGDEWEKGPSPEHASGPTITYAHESSVSTDGPMPDAPQTSGGAERASSSTEMPSLSGLDHATRAFVTAIYGRTFDRLPEVVELKLWSRHLKAGVDPRLVAWRIWTSAEHRRLQRHGIVAPKAFQRTYEAAAAAVQRARSDQLSPPSGPMALTAHGTSPMPSGAGQTRESHPTSPDRRPANRFRTDRR